MNILFLNPPWLENGREGVRAGSRWPYTLKKLEVGSTIPFPFYMAYSAAILREKGFDVEIIDGIASKMTLDQFYNGLEKKNPDLILLETSTPSYEYDRKVVDELRKKFKDAKIVFSGPHSSVFPEDVLSANESLDYVIIGEYEYTIKELAETLDAGDSPNKVKGMAYRANGGVITNDRRGLIENLDELPLPARDLLPIYKYNDSFCKHGVNVQLTSSRGCLFSCPFCVWPRVMYGGQSYRTRSAGNIVDEIEHLIDNYKFKELYFDDDAINLKRGHVQRLCEELQRRGIDISWSCMGHATITREILEFMHTVGCEGIKFGVETGDADILKSLNKGLTKEMIKKRFKWCKEIGIRTHATFTVGLPGETLESIENTKKFLLELEPDSAQFSITIPFPGTPYYEEAIEKNWFVTKGWSKFDGSYGAIIKTDSISPEILESSLEEIKELWGSYAIFKHPLRSIQSTIKRRGFVDFMKCFPRHLINFRRRHGKMKRYT